MAKKRITQITVERTAFLTTDYFAIDSATGTNNTGRISGPNLLAQLANGPTSPTFQVKLSTLATAGLGGVSRLARGFDIFGSNPKATTAAVENLLQVASNDAANPLALRFGVTTHATAGSRNGIIEVDDAGAKRSLVFQPTSGTVGVGAAVAGSRFAVIADGLNTTFGTSGATDGRMEFARAGVRKGLLAWSDSFVTLNADVGMPLRLQANNATQVTIDINGNIGFGGQTTFGSGAVKVMALGNGTIPGTIADGFQLVSADVVAGQAAPHFVIENGPVIRLYQQAHIADPAAGGTVDAEARTAINAILVALENTRLLAAA